jgi:hypothetical protein
VVRTFYPFPYARESDTSGGLYGPEWQRKAANARESATPFKFMRIVQAAAISTVGFGNLSWTLDSTRFRFWGQPPKQNNLPKSIFQKMIFNNKKNREVYVLDKFNTCSFRTHQY